MEQHQVFAVSICLLHDGVYRYIEEHIQRTGVAIETQGFTLVTSGKRRETLKVSRRLSYGEMLPLETVLLFYMWMVARYLDLELVFAEDLGKSFSITMMNKFQLTWIRRVSPPFHAFLCNNVLQKKSNE